MTLIETAKMNGHVAKTYLSDVLGRINVHIHPRLCELLPSNWKPLPANSESKIAANLADVADGIHNDVI